VRKSIWKSKTVWVALLWAALTAFTPLIESYVKENPTFVMCLISFVVIFLRFITKSGVKLK
jgi:hypothetical protein